MYDLNMHLYRQRAFSRATFGPGPRTKMVVDHIRKELIEIEGAPFDLEEWIDVVLLALDGAWRCAEAMGVPHDLVPARVVEALALKQLNNEMRDWPNWRTSDPDKAIEHVRPSAQPDGFPDHMPGSSPAPAPSGPCPKARAGVPRRPCLYPQCDCENLIGGPGRC